MPGCTDDPGWHPSRIHRRVHVHPARRDAGTELRTASSRRVEETTSEEPSLGDMHVGTIQAYYLRVLRDRDPECRAFEVINETR